MLLSPSIKPLRGLKLSEVEISVPQMIGFDKLIKIIIGYLKVGAIEEPKSYSDVASVSGISQNTVGLNAKFFEYIGLLEGTRGSYKLNDKGKRYAQALDWGRLAEANSILREAIKDNELVKRALAYVDMNQPVNRNDLVSQIALISGKPKEDRYTTGIKAFVEMLVTSGLLESDSQENLTVSKQKKEEQIVFETPVSIPLGVGASQPAKPPAMSLPVTLSINIDDKTDINKLKEVLRAIKEVFSES
jgi:hypothetical protein